MEEYRRWEDNIKMDLTEIGVDVINWKELAKDTHNSKFLFKIQVLYIVDASDTCIRRSDNKMKS